VGIRILDKQGNIPYEAYTGFSREFYVSESPLSIESDQCMCINVVKGNTDPSLPFYTEYGSFFINGTTTFLATVPDDDKSPTRNVCNAQGYESVALVPIRLGNSILGLIHIADNKTDMVPLELVNTLEDVSPQIGLTIRRVWAEHELYEEKKRLEVTLRSTGDGIIAVDTNGIVLLLNRAAEQMTGWTQEEAIEIYIQAMKTGNPFNAVIMDLTIPGRMGGKEAVNKLLDVDPDAKVIVSSGYATDPVMAEYAEYGFKAVVTKPYSVTDIEMTLQRVLEKD
jgi:PAS domain-containing protein